MDKKGKKKKKKKEKKRKEKVMQAYFVFVPLAIDKEKKIFLFHKIEMFLQIQFHLVTFVF